MGVNRRRCPGQADAVDQARMVPLVRNDEVVRVRDSLQQTDVCGIARSEEQGALRSGKRCETLFDPLEYLVMTTEQARAARPCGHVVERRADRFREIGVRRKPEVVVRYEIDAGRQPHLAKEPAAAQLSERGCETVLEFLPGGHA